MNLWLPVAVLLLGLPALGLWCELAARGRVGLREAAIWTAILWAVWASLGAELLSFGAGHDLLAPRGGAFTRAGVALLWLPPAVFGGVLLARRRSWLADAFSAHRERLRQLTGLDRLLVMGAMFCVVAVAAMALLYAPNTWDSMTYHLARVTSWLQLGGIRHYTTNAEPQLFHPPGSELLIAEWQALVGGDRMAALVQWSAYVIAILATSLIAARLGGARRAQLLAALLTATAPMAILQGSSTQNDLVTAAWLLAAGALAIGAWNSPELAARRLLLASVAVGLAILTKGTALMYAPWILLLVAWAGFRQLGWQRAVALGLGCLLAIALLNAGQWQRNIETYDSPVYGGKGLFDYSNDSHTPKAVASNLVRNAAIYVGTPKLSANDLPTDVVRGALEAAGIDPDDPATTFPGQRFAIDRSGPQESHAPGLLLFLLTIWALGATLFWQRMRTPLRLTWALVVILQILSFAVAIKWQPWHSRLHLPFALAAVPLIALLLAELRRGWPAKAAVAVAALTAPIYIFGNIDRPLVGDHSLLTTSREEQYFTPRRDLFAPYTAASAELRKQGVETVGMSGNFDDWFYPFDPLAGDDARRWSYELVANPSLRYRGRRPQAVLCINCDQPRSAALTAAGFAQTGSWTTPPADVDERTTTLTLWTAAD